MPYRSYYFPHILSGNVAIFPDIMVFLSDISECQTPVLLPAYVHVNHDWQGFVGCRICFCSYMSLFCTYTCYNVILYVYSIRHTLFYACLFNGIISPIPAQHWALFHRVPSLWNLSFYITVVHLICALFEWHFLSFVVLLVLLRKNDYHFTWEKHIYMKFVDKVGQPMCDIDLNPGCYQLQWIT